MSPSTGDDDLFSDFPRVSAEDILRQTLRRVLADGIVTDGERLEVQELRKSLGIAPSVAARVLSEVKAEMGVSQPISTGLSIPHVVPPLTNSPPPLSTSALPSRSVSQSGSAPSIEFRCIRCGKLLRTGDATTGMQAQCPACGAVMMVPSASTIGGDPGLIMPPSPISQQPVIGPTAAVPGFGQWYTTKFGQLPLVVHVFMWLFYGYLWIPIFYFASRQTGHAVSAGTVQVQQRVRGPSLALLITGILGAGLGAIMALAAISEPGEAGTTAPPLFFSLIGAAVQALVAYAGFQMMNLKNYRLAMIGSVLAMLPCSACCLLGLPMGIWSVTLLTKPEVRNAFH